MNRRTAPFAIGLIGLSVLLVGCSFAPTHERPDTAVPHSWNAERSSISLSPATPDTSKSSAATLGWEAFVSDPQLRELVALSLNQNRSLRQAVLDVEAARATYRIQRAERMPNIAAQGSGTRQRTPADLSATGTSQVQSTYQAGIGLSSFELDIFSRVRNLSEAAAEEFLAVQETAHAVRVGLVAEVIQAYLVRDSALRRLQIAKDTLGSREASLRVMTNRHDAGTATELDRQEALGLAEQARAELARIERELHQSGTALGLLVGNSEVRLSQLPSEGDVLVQDLQAGAPSELLTNRADVRAAEHRLRSRNASIGAARAAFFPRISLTGMFGSSSAELSDLFSSGQRSWSFAPQISIPIFSGGANRANLDLAQVRKDSAIVAYEDVVHTAFREVSDALSAGETLRREEAARRALAASSARALLLTEARWRAGVDDHIRYLDAQRNDFTNKVALIDVSTQRQVALAQLFKSLGGGWPSSDAAVSAPTERGG